MTDDITRREFLARNIAAGTLLMAHTRLDQRLTAREQRTLLAVARSMFPHQDAPPGAYARAIALVDRRCQIDSAYFRTVVSGLASLEWSCAGQFCLVGDRARIQLLSVVENTGFFRLVYRQLLDGLYGNAAIWSLFRSGSAKGAA